ncbi:MAG: AAA family ATPase [Gemmatimonadota bacterium]|nr:AAA family ATPase [Gemmatimonadota bacterium]
MRDTQHLDKLRISGFRGLSSLDLKDLGSFNILLGANDTGKTSTLEAIFLLLGFPNLELPIRVHNWRNYLVHGLDALSPLFHKLDVDKQIRLEAQSCDSTERALMISAPYAQPTAATKTQRVESDANGDAVKIQSDEQARVQSSSSIPSGPRFLQYDATVKLAPQEDPIPFSGRLVMREGHREITWTPDTVADMIIPVRYFSAHYGYDGNIIADLIINKKTDELLEYLRVINPRIADITVSGDVAYLDIGLEKMMPLNMFGGGMIRAATILSPCILGNEQIVLIDELENGLHYQAILPLLKALFRLSNERHVQVFATTHSLEILKGLQQVLSQDQFSENQQTTNCYTLQRDEQGLVRSYRYGYDQLEHCIAHGIEIR